MRWAAVYAPTSTICEVREGDSPPAYTPADCEWVDVTDRPETDMELVGAQWIDGAPVLNPVPPDFSPQLDMGGSIAQIIGK